jgi:8-amino-7-oxononanoate synthase
VGSVGKEQGKGMKMASLDEFLKEKLSKRYEQGLLRRLTTSQLPVDFVSNDYLGLARSKELSALIENTHRKLGIQNGSMGSRLLAGNSPYFQEVEKKLSSVFKSEASLIFNSGYSANLAVLSSVPQKGDTIIYDTLAHACIKDGARLSLAARHSFRHNDLNDLESKIKVSEGKIFIAVESVYSMDGDECPLREIIHLSEKYNASVILDEAHSTGVTGPQGAGLSVAKDLHQKIDIRIYTFGKGMGVHGACVAGSEPLIRYLVNFARPFIYTTALSQHSVASIDCAFAYLSANMNLQQTLRKKIDLYLSGIRDLHNRTASLSAIQTILYPGNEVVKRAADSLQQKGFDIRPIVYPTVPKETERLRICLHSFNSDDEITALTQALNELA